MGPSETPNNEIQTKECTIQSRKHFKDVESLKEANIDKEKAEVNLIALNLGCLKLFINNWNDITTNKLILQWLKGYKIPFKESSKQVNLPKESNWATEEFNKTKVKIKKLLAKQAIEKCEDCEEQFISTYFLVSKA